METITFWRSWNYRGGDFREAIYILNHEHITITDIEVNNGEFLRTSVDSTLSYGIYFHNSG